MQPTNRAAAILLGIVTTILLGWVLKVGAGIIQPIVIALLLASMLSPVVRGLARFGLPPIVSVLGMVTLLGFGIFQGVVLAQANIEEFLRDTPTQIAPGDAQVGGADGTPEVADGPGAPGAGANASESPSAPEGVQAAGLEGEAGPAGDQESALEPSPAGASEQNAAESIEVPRAAPDTRFNSPEQKPDFPDGLDPEAVGGFLTQLQNEQDAAIEQAGGLRVIVDKLIVRVQSSSLPEPVINYLVQELTDLKQEGRAQDLAQQFLGGGLSIFRMLILVLVYMLFIFAEQAVFRRKILAVAGDRREEAANILDTIGRGIQQFLGIKTLISLATAALCYSVLVSLRIPYALLFAILTFFLNFIPYFGSLIAGLLPAIVAVAIEPSIDKAVIIGITYITVNVVLGSFVEPKIMGRELDLSPLVIIVSVVVWGSLWGVVGAFLAVPLMATAQIVLASSEPTRPIAVMLSSGPPREPRRGFRRATA